MRRLAILAPLLVAGCGNLVTFDASAPEPANVKDIGTPKRVANINDSRLNESSGLAAATDGTRYFTHNDSGDFARFFSFRIGSGRGLSEYTVGNAKNVDWEDMAVAKVGGKPYVYLADIGDNSKRRDSVKVYRVPEPATPGAVTADEVYELEYPNGPHNAEAIIVDGKRNRLQIISKTSDEKAGVYEANLSGSGKIKLKKLGGVGVGGFIKEARLITGASLSPDGQYIALRTYLAGYQFLYRGHESDWFEQRPTNVPLAITSQGESISYSHDGNRILTTSEGKPCPVHEIDLGR